MIVGGLLNFFKIKNELFVAEVREVILWAIVFYSLYLYSNFH